MNQFSQDLIILTSPPASGKTYWITGLKEAFKGTKLLVISPLRALADECRNRWGDSVSVVTPEEWLGKKIFAEIVIIDEFHLFFYWGDSFRPLMWEVFYEISEKCKILFLLTATLSSAMKEETSLFSTQFDGILWLNFGNQTLKYNPAKYLKAPSRAWLLNQIENEPYGKNVKLIFCQYRSEVFEMEKKLKKLGFSCLTCVGGQSKFMAEKLQETPEPDFIISTTVLSHGVNLPSISRIYFLYSVGNIDFWIQMVARGGRKGENFEVLGLERPYGLKWNRFQNFISLSFISIKNFFSLKSFTAP